MAGGSPPPSPDRSSTLPAWYVLVTSGSGEEGAGAPPEPFGGGAASGLERPASGVGSVVRSGSLGSSGFTGHLGPGRHRGMLSRWPSYFTEGPRGCPARVGPTRRNGFERTAMVG